MSTIISIIISITIIFAVEWIFALALHRLNRKACADMVKAIDAQVELEDHLVNVIADLRSMQPEKDEILEITALQIQSLRESTKDNRIVMDEMSTKLPFWTHLAPLSAVASRQKRRRGEQRARTEQLREWRERHGHDDPDLP